MTLRTLYSSARPSTSQKWFSTLSHTCLIREAQHSGVTTSNPSYARRSTSVRVNAWLFAFMWPLTCNHANSMGLRVQWATGRHTTSWPAARAIASTTYLGVRRNPYMIENNSDFKALGEYEISFPSSHSIILFLVQLFLPNDMRHYP